MEITITVNAWTWLYFYSFISIWIVGYQIKAENFLDFSTVRDSLASIATLILLLLLSPILVVADFFYPKWKSFIKWLDKYIQFRFYWIYFRGGFYNIDERRLTDFDRECFKIEYNQLKSLKHKHYLHVSNLIFKRNNYQRKVWGVENGMLHHITQASKREKMWKKKIAARRTYLNLLAHQ